MAMRMRGGRDRQCVRRRHLLAPRAEVRLGSVSVVHAKGKGKWAVWGSYRYQKNHNMRRRYDTGRRSELNGWGVVEDRSQQRSALESRLYLLR